MPVVFFLLILTAAQGMIFAIRHNQLLMNPDTRIVARQWVIENIPARSKIATEDYGLNLRDFKQKRTRNGYDLIQAGKTLPKKELKFYRNRGVEYIVTSDYVRKRYFIYGDRFSKEKKFYKSLDNSSKEIFSIAPAGQKIPFIWMRYIPPFGIFSFWTARVPCSGFIEFNKSLKNT